MLFAGTDQRLRAMAEAFDAIQADSPVEAVHRIFERVLAASDDLSGPDRLGIMLARPELQAQGLQRLNAAQRLIAEWLLRALPGRQRGRRARGHVRDRRRRGGRAGVLATGCVGLNADVTINRTQALVLGARTCETGT